MVIGAHISGDDAEESLLFFALRKVATLQPQHNFILFTSTVLQDLQQNFVQVNISPKPNNRLLLSYWYKYKLQTLLSKNNVTVFLSNEGMMVDDFNGKQYLFIENRNLFLPQKNFLKRNFVTSVEKAQTVFVTDTLLAHEYKKKLSTEKLKQINFNKNESGITFSIADLENIKDAHSAGLDYFLFSVNRSSKAHIITVLKAFSQLKKWQKTSLKLMLLFEDTIDETLLPDFKNYKYKNEVLLVKETQEISLKIKAASFVYIFLGDYKDSRNIYEILQHNIPVIVADVDDNHLLFKNAVAYASATVEGLGQQLQNIYKDEIFRLQLIRNTNILLTKFDNETNAQILLDVIAN